MSQDLVRLVREARVALEHHDHHDDDFRASSFVAETGRLFRRPNSQAGKFILLNSKGTSSKVLLPPVCPPFW